MVMENIASAHPLTEHGALPVSPLTAAALLAWLLLCVGIARPARAARAGSAVDDAAIDSWRGPLSGPQRAGRFLGVALLLLAVAAGRLGSPLEIENLAPALVVGAGWPLLLLAAALASHVWRWLDPWDGLARALVRPGAEDRPATHVWAALPAAAGWTWYVSAYPFATSPRSVGAVLALYTIVTLGGCLLAGRVAWLSGAEMLGLFLGWLARLPRARLSRWDPPRGAEVMVGVLAGGVLFGPLRHSELWGELNVVPRAALYSLAGVAACWAAGAAILRSLERWGTRLGAAGMVTRASVPAVASIAIAVALERNRLFTSLQLLPGLIGDPFGWGWDLLGPALRGLDPEPVGAVGLAVAQLAVLFLGHAAGLFVAVSGVRSSHRWPAVAASAVMSSGGAIAVLAT